MEVIPFEARSTLEEKFISQWEINLEDRSCSSTAAFNPIEKDDTKFFFEIWFQRNKKGYEETASLQVFLRKVADSLVHSKLWFEFQVFVYFSDGSLCKDYKPDNFVELAKFAERICISAVFQIYTNKNYSYTTEGLNFRFNKLTLKCQMNFTGHISPTSFYNNISELKIFETFYLSDELSDLDIQIGDKSVKSHKFILAAHSPVFKKMLTQDFQEAKSGRITISDFEPDVFEKFLKFLYFCKIEVGSFSDFKPLYSLAHKYDVQILKQECYKMLTNISLTEEQIVDILQLAYQYNDDKLKKTSKCLLLKTVKKA